MKVRLEVTGAYVDGHGPGSIVSVDEKSAKQLESIGYGKILKDVEEPKKADDSKTSEKSESKPKSKPKGKRKNKED
jgi:hypothetical protein